MVTPPGRGATRGAGPARAGWRARGSREGAATRQATTRREEGQPAVGSEDVPGVRTDFRGFAGAFRVVAGGAIPHRAAHAPPARVRLRLAPDPTRRGGLRLAGRARP